MTDPTDAQKAADEQAKKEAAARAKADRDAKEQFDAAVAAQVAKVLAEREAAEAEAQAQPGPVTTNAAGKQLGPRKQR